MLTYGNRTVAVGVFDDITNARRAVAELKDHGFTDREIGVAARHYEVRHEDKSDEEETHADEGAMAGAVAGLGVGGLWALGIIAGVVPAIGPAIAGGILGSILSSAAVGAVAGGILGALIGLGIPEKHAQFYHDEFERGRTIVTVRTSNADRLDEAVSILQRHRAYDAGAVVEDTAPETDVVAEPESVRRT